jgi:hypothetical protein
MIGGLKKPERYSLPSDSRNVNEIVQTAVGLLPTLEAIFRRDVPVANVEPGREIGALSHIPYLVIYDENIDSAGLKAVRNPELAERACSIVVKW